MVKMGKKKMPFSGTAKWAYAGKKRKKKKKMGAIGYSQGFV
jgi:hypothetical protein